MCHRLQAVITSRLTLCVLSLLLPCSAQSPPYREVVLHSYATADGIEPYPGVLGYAGALYTATQLGGVYGYGTVFKLDKDGASTLYNFTGGSDGAEPHAGLIADKSGNLYGTTFYGGASGYGTVFKVSPTGSETVLHSFAGGSDGAYPSAILTRSPSGAVYGTASGGGSFGYGAIFEISASGAESILYSFSNGSDGGTPVSTLLPVGSSLYGVTSGGGAFGVGTVFEFSPKTKLLTTLYTFTGGADGGSPLGGLSRDSSGNFYGTARFGGIYGDGVVFSLTETTETVRYSFTGGEDGSQPLSGVILDPSGNMYGTAWQGGAYGAGVVFEVTPANSESVLYTFTGGKDGLYPEASLIRDALGNLYSNTFYGGANGLGALYKLIP